MDIQVHRHCKNVPLAAEGSVVAIGSFDGVHKGHQQVLELALNKAKELNLPCIVLTFAPHPRQVLGFESGPWQVSTFRQKVELLNKLGVDALYVIRFTKAYAHTTAESFITETLAQTLHAKHVVVGEDFKFGYKRAGDTALLEAEGEKQGFTVDALSKVVCTEDERYASSRIRKLLLQGDTKAAKEVLGRPFLCIVNLREDDQLNLTASLKRYTALKNGVYWAVIRYTSASGDIFAATIPVVVKENAVFIRPLAEMPDIPEGRHRLEFLETVSEERI